MTVDNAQGIKFVYDKLLGDKEVTKVAMGLVLGWATASVQWATLLGWVNASVHNLCL